MFDDVLDRGAILVAVVVPDEEVAAARADSNEEYTAGVVVNDLALLVH